MSSIDPIYSAPEPLYVPPSSSSSSVNSFTFDTLSSSVNTNPIYLTDASVNISINEFLTTVRGAIKDLEQETRSGITTLIEAIAKLNKGSLSGILSLSELKNIISNMYETDQANRDEGNDILDQQEENGDDLESSLSSYNSKRSSYQTNATSANNQIDNLNGSHSGQTPYQALTAYNNAAKAYNNYIGSLTSTSSSTVNGIINKMLPLIDSFSNFNVEFNSETTSLNDLREGVFPSLSNLPLINDINLSLPYTPELFEPLPVYEEPIPTNVTEAELDSFAADLSHVQSSYSSISTSVVPDRPYQNLSDVDSEDPGYANPIWGTLLDTHVASASAFESLLSRLISPEDLERIRTKKLLNLTQRLNEVASGNLSPSATTLTSVIMGLESPKLESVISQQMIEEDFRKQLLELTPEQLRNAVPQIQSFALSLLQRSDLFGTPEAIDLLENHIESLSPTSPTIDLAFQVSSLKYLVNLLNSTDLEGLIKKQLFETPTFKGIIANLSDPQREALVQQIKQSVGTSVLVIAGSQLLNQINPELLSLLAAIILSPKLLAAVESNNINLSFDENVKFNVAAPQAAPTLTAPTNAPIASTAPTTPSAPIVAASAPTTSASSTSIPVSSPNVAASTSSIETPTVPPSVPAGVAAGVSGKAANVPLGNVPIGSMSPPIHPAAATHSPTDIPKDVASDGISPQVIAILPKLAVLATEHPQELTKLLTEALIEGGRDQETAAESANAFVEELIARNEDEFNVLSGLDKLFEDNGDFVQQPTVFGSESPVATTPPTSPPSPMIPPQEIEEAFVAHEVKTTEEAAPFVPEKRGDERSRLDLERIAPVLALLDGIQPILDTSNIKPEEAPNVVSSLSRFLLSNDIKTSLKEQHRLRIDRNLSEELINQITNVLLGVDLSQKITEKDHVEGTRQVREESVVEKILHRVKDLVKEKNEKIEKITLEEFDDRIGNPSNVAKALQESAEPMKQAIRWSMMLSAPPSIFKSTPDSSGISG